MNKGRNSKTPHILNTSATILGLCAVLVTGIKLTNNIEKTLFDELLILTGASMYISCVLSYLSIRLDHSNATYENWADIIFLGGLFLLLTCMLLVGISIL